MVAGSTMSAKRAVSVMNCSLDANEQVLAGKAAFHHPASCSWRDRKRIGVLDEERRHLRPARKRVIVAFQDGADARLVEQAHRRSRTSSPSIIALSKW